MFMARIQQGSFYLDSAGHPQQYRFYPTPPQMVCYNGGDSTSDSLHNVDAMFTFNPWCTDNLPGWNPLRDLSIILL